MLNGWGGYLLTEANDVNAFFGHEEFIQCFSTHQSNLDQVRKTLQETREIRCDTFVTLDDKKGRSSIGPSRAVVWRVFPVGTGRRLRNGRVALSATRVRLPCPPHGARPQLLMEFGRSGTISLVSQVASICMDTPNGKGSGLIPGAFVFSSPKPRGTCPEPRFRRYLDVESCVARRIRLAVSYVARARFIAAAG
jgi:hypothetical protein